MAMADIQLTANPDQQLEPGYMAERKSTISYGDHEPERIEPEELKDEALSRQQVEQFLFEIKQQPSWRREADKCSDYYDGNQLSPETVETLHDRGQPPLIANLIKPTIDTVLGMEAKTRTDWRVRPEDDEVSEDDLADAMSVKLKHAEIESRADRACSDAYAAQLKAGVGWVEVGREHDPFRCSYRVGYVHRREIFWDWRSEKYDLSDARYLVRRRWLDLEHAIGMMPQYASLFRMATSNWAGFDPMIEQDTKLVQSFEIERDTKMEATDWRDVQRERVCMYEMWYRKWVRGHVMKLPNGRVLEVDFGNPRHCEVIVSGVAKVWQATFQKVRLAWYVGPHFLYDIPSPYKHNNFPYVPFFGYREDLTQAPYGMIRAMLSPQDEVNARKSKMLWSLNSRRVVTDSDAVKDHNQTAKEVARADAYIILDKDRKPGSAFRVDPAGEMAATQFQVMQESKQEIAEASGVHKSMQGQASSATSGLAINSLVEQGLNTLAEINDNYRFARRLVGEMLFGLVQEDLSEGPKRVTIGEGKKKRIIILNQRQQDPESGQVVMLNDVSKLKAKIVLDDIPSTPTYRMQLSQAMSEIIKSLPPNMQAVLAPDWIESTDMPNRHDIADKLRNAGGIQDEEQQKQAQEAQQGVMKQQQDIAQKTFVLDSAVKAADVRKLNAEADLAEARAQQLRIPQPAPAMQVSQQVDR